MGVRSGRGRAVQANAARRSFCSQTNVLLLRSDKVRMRRQEEFPPPGPAGGTAANSCLIPLEQALTFPPVTSLFSYSRSNKLLHLQLFYSCSTVASAFALRLCKTCTQIGHRSRQETQPASVQCAGRNREK